MLTTYHRLMTEARITRHRESTYDHRDPYVLIAQLEAEVEALRRRVREACEEMRQYQLAQGGDVQEQVSVCKEAE